MMTNRRPSVAALCCHISQLHILQEHAGQVTSVPLSDAQHLETLLKGSEVVVVPGVERQLGQLTEWPSLPIIDLEVEVRRLNNGVENLHPIAMQLMPASNHKASIGCYLQKTIVLGQQLLEKVSYQQAVERGQTACDHLVVSQQGLPLNLTKLAAFQQNAKPQFVNLCRELGLQDVFRLGQLSRSHFNDYLASNHAEIWPQNDRGAFRTDKDTLSDMAKMLGGEIETIYQLYKLARWLEIQITTDERGYHNIRQQPYGTKTGRCKAVGSSVLALPKIMRKALLARDDRYLVEVDVCSQDVAVAAGLSGDPRMIATYESEDFYIAAGRELAGNILQGVGQSRLRSISKLMTLAVFYGMSSETLACKLRCSVSDADELIASYKASFSVFEDWVSENIFNAYRDCQISTASGWQMHVNASTKDRTLMNWPIQATGADLMNLALRKALSRNLQIGAVNHDALYISADTQSEASHAADQITQCIHEAAEEIIPAIKIKTTTTLLGPEQSKCYPSSLQELLAHSNRASKHPST